MSFYIILRGPAGAGKTTIAERLTQIYGAHHIPIDEVKKGLGLKNSEEEKLKANEVVILDALKHLEQGEIVIIDEVFYYKKQLDQLEQLPFKSFIFSLNAPLDICIERNKARRTAGTRKMKDEDVVIVHSLASKLKSGIEIDAYNRPVDETLKEILSYLPKPE